MAHPIAIKSNLWSPTKISTFLQLPLLFQWAAKFEKQYGSLSDHVYAWYNELLLFAHWIPISSSGLVLWLKLNWCLTIT